MRSQRWGWSTCVRMIRRGCRLMLRSHRSAWRSRLAPGPYWPLLPATILSKKISHWKSLSWVIDLLSDARTFSGLCFSWLPGGSERPWWCIAAYCLIPLVLTFVFYLQLNGHYHYCRQPGHSERTWETGPTALKRHLLEQLGWMVLPIRLEDWDVGAGELSSADRLRRLLRRRVAELEARGEPLRLSATGAAPEDLAARH